jgi:hypothetical protein
MITKREIAGKERIVVEFEKDIFISTFEVNTTLKVLLTLSDKTEQFRDNNGKLNLDKDYDMEGQTFESIDPGVVLEFSDTRSIRNMIEMLKDAEVLLENKQPKKKSRKG